ncbi:hypothetical protein [Francisella sp. LA112445]|uniref:hypothetical protein n=1 Tax=Francisella sp. LA112445 TaxID=1395624 RepID=UPI001788E690|nr:hypothetical protein [Francisella sp. LA112445]QIW10584.1 hypothetical protein FIP56_07670 [Francisella sp. LA112445]
MIKKLISCVFIFLILFNYGLSSDNTAKAPVNTQNTSKDTQVSDKSTLNKIVVTPIKDIGIGAASLIMAPVGAFVGLFKGATMSQQILYNGEHHSGDSDIVNIVVAPIAAAGFALGGAIYMVFKLPQETAKSLSQKEDN